MSVLQLLGVMVLALIFLALFFGLIFFLHGDDSADLGVGWAIVATALYLAAVCAWALKVPFPLF